MSAPSPQKLQEVMAQVAKIRASLADVDAEDVLQVLAEDTEVMTLLDRLEELVSMRRDYAARALARAAQLERQAEIGRGVMQRILEALDRRKLERPAYTASLVKAPRSLNLVDAEAIPFEFLVPVPDKGAITKALKAGQEVPGAALSEPRDTLRITRGSKESSDE